MPAAARAESEAGARPYFKRSYATLRAGPRRGARLPFFDEARARRVRSVDCHAVGAGAARPRCSLDPVNVSSGCFARHAGARTAHVVPLAGTGR